MTAMRRLVLTVFAVAALSGCHGGMPPRRAMTANEPPLDAGDGTVVAAVPKSAGPAWVERHPLFYKPRDYYESSGENKVVKAAAATVVGIPVGVYGELKQIVVGAPGDKR